MRILIATWGNFRSWDEIEYIFGNKKKKSNCPLSILHEVIKPDKTIIFTLDTLTDFPSKNYEDIIKEVKEKTFEFIEKLHLLIV
ncbi:TM1812 family CRISPR-associated protein [Methanotorris formicicus]|uniref:CRISPR-associated protein DxTHG n=1 Tax=Methanotorris formicicus Mc-S-70 TaxID=647171 RepID=H1KYS6_9EURY|nr:TM1812 family CRISPR-associated protein [Methanotorris formicicus]EHP86823.1 CRISPR-associated protein DxTHG [Methanotorris formicicus Mc-S-70]